VSSAGFPVSLPLHICSVVTVVSAVCVSLQVVGAGTADELTRAEATCVHCGAPGSIRDFLKEGQYCSPQCAVVSARKYVQLSHEVDFRARQPKMLSYFAI